MSGGLFVCAFSPAPNATQAGHRLAFCFLEEWCRAGPVDLVLLLSQHEVVSPQIEALPNLRIARVFRFSRIDKLRAVASSLVTSAPRFATRARVDIERYLAQAVGSGRYRRVRLEFSQTFHYVKAIRAAAPDLAVDASVHDVQSQVLSRKPAWESRLFLRRTQATERDLLRRMTTIAVLSDKDAGLLRQLYDLAPPIRRQSFPLSPFAENFAREPGQVERRSLLFWGAMSRTENERAALWFIEQCFRPLAEKFADLRLLVVGSGPSPKLLSYRCDRIEVTGFVEDPTPYFQRARIGVVPLAEGAGVKLKTLEMLRCGLLVVSTEVGAEGIDATPALQVETRERFRQALDEILSRPLEPA